MLWCDQPDHASYNRLVRAPFCRSHEEMMRKDGLYDICLVLDWNITSRRRHRGSAIFFHIAREGYRPTEGCVAISLADRSEEHTSELQSLMRISYAVFRLKKKKTP